MLLLLLLLLLLQTSLAHASPGVAAASLQVVEAVLLQQPQLRLLLSEKEKELQQTDEAFAVGSSKRLNRLLAAVCLSVSLASAA